jgi:hypothetical protein
VQLSWSRVAASVLWAAFASAAVSAETREAGESKRPIVKESVGIELVQLEVTVWPKEAGSAACMGLTAGDFDLQVDGKPAEIYAVDPRGSDEETLLPGAGPAAEPRGGGMTLVLFFDLWHLDIFHRDFNLCPRTKPLAFEEARRLAREGLHPGDRLLLVTFAGWPTIHYGWLRDPVEAVEALDRLEKNQQVVAPYQTHLHHNRWIDGIESLFLALGRYPGRKDVVYLGDDFRFDDVAFRMYEIAARAQANGVVVNAVDLVATCRSFDGPGPGRECPPTGGLGCTEFNRPVALNPISRDTGGALFRHERIAEAVGELRSMRKCQYTISFRRSSKAGKGTPKVVLGLRGDRKDVTLSLPSSYQTSEHAPSQRDQDEAFFLLPRFGRGISAEVALWPYRPHGKRGRWNSLVLVRLERTDDVPWPEELTEISVDVLVHQRSKVRGEFRKRIAGDELKVFRARGRERLMVFAVEGVRPGEAAANVTITGNAEGISAKVVRSITVPEPPGPGEARPWILSDRFARVGESVLRAPSLDGVVSSGELASILAYGCRLKGKPAETYTGRLVPFGGGPAVPVRVAWLEGPARRADGCGWLIAEIDPSLKPGVWTFEPPASLGGEERALPVEFSVEGSGEAEGIPAESRFN